MANKIIKIDPDFRTGAGVSFRFSWDGLEKMLRKDKAIAQNEKVSGYHIDDHGIQFYVRKKVQGDD